MTGSARVLLLLAAGMLGAGTAEARGPNVNYALKCQGCHTHEGISPELGRIPALKDTVGHFLRVQEGRRYMANVPGIRNSGLDEAETADLLNWVVKTYGGTSRPEPFEPFTAAEIGKWKSENPDDVMKLRAEVRALLDARGYSIGAYP